ncbi:MAG: YdiU family protein [Gudongella sp.]|nr:YdiU family protein [Gudongella sp.]
MKNIDSGFNLENSYTDLPKLFYTKIKPKMNNVSKIVVLNENLAKVLGIKIDYLKSKEGTQMLAGNSIPEGSTLIAQAYSGHQFGHFTMLGDGRAMLIGEQITPNGERFDIQLKGSGKTPYSRGGDGRAALGPMLREYIISEAMYYLGVPTTRSLAVVQTDDKVYRESPLKGAVLTRIAKSHIRVGTFQYANKYGKTEDIKALADYTIKRHFPNILESANPYIELLRQVSKAQASLIAKWQLVGFVHGVMNTDNMSIAGETIDYGPCAFMDVYNPKTKFSSIDHQGRYAYGNQPGIALWNLSRFAETILSLIDDDNERAIEIAQTVLQEFGTNYEMAYYSGMCDKLGFYKFESSDKKLIDDLLFIMEKHMADYTNVFLGLIDREFSELDFFETEDFKVWEKEYQSRLKKEDKNSVEVKELMRSSNPAVIPRNYLVEEALKNAVEKNDYLKFNELLEALRNTHNPSEVDKKFMKIPEPSLTPYKTYCGT